MMICIPCGYIYEQNEQPFSALTKDWCCPECGANLQSFAEIDESLPKQAKAVIDVSKP